MTSYQYIVQVTYEDGKILQKGFDLLDSQTANMLDSFDKNSEIIRFEVFVKQRFSVAITL